MTAAEAATAIGVEVQRGDVTFALRLLARAIAVLRSLADRPADLAEFLTTPPTTGDRRWDTLLAAALGRECRRLGVAPPAWTNVAPLKSWWFPVPDPVLTARTFQRTPVELSVRGIWLDGSALEAV